jgi:glycerol-3-phosphate acyltransferase PlsY
MTVLLPVLSYLLGAVPFGLLVGRLAGIDVRKGGSGNIGATNVSRLLGKKLGFVTLILDCLKGFLPIYIASQVVGEEAGSSMVVMLCGIMAVIGHMFPVYLGFKGGKGVATALGVFLYLSPPAIGISVLVFAAAVAFSGFVSAGSLLASGLFPMWLWFFGQPAPMVLTGLVIAVLIWIKHHENISRLMAGKEKSWKKTG